MSGGADDAKFTEWQNMMGVQGTAYFENSAAHYIAYGVVDELAQATGID